MNELVMSPVDYGGLRLKNRIIFAPTTLGLPREAYHEQIRRIAGGGCAMVIIGDVPVGKGGWGRDLFSAKGFESYKQLTDLIHSGDCRACAQLHQSDSDVRAMFRHIPALLAGRADAAQMRTWLNEAVGPYISGLPARKIQEIAASFGEAAVQAQRAGFDMVQVHGDRMCGSLSSGLYNRRTDAYGGSLENRLRFAVEAVRAIRERLPQMPVDFKLVVRQENPHYGNAGLLPEELETAIPLLERAGVTSFHVTLANHASLTDPIPPANHPHFGAEGCFLGFCDLVRRYTALPVCGVGGLTSPEFIERQIAAGRMDCAAMSRQLIADPDWPRKVMEGRTEQICRCVRCNQCLEGLMRHRGVHCIYERRAET